MPRSQIPQPSSASRRRASSAWASASARFAGPRPPPRAGPYRRNWGWPGGRRAPGYDLGSDWIAQIAHNNRAGASANRIQITGNRVVGRYLSVSILGFHVENTAHRINGGVEQRKSERHALSTSFVVTQTKLNAASTKTALTNGERDAHNLGMSPTTPGNGCGQQFGKRPLRGEQISASRQSAGGGTLTLSEHQQELGGDPTENHRLTIDAERKHTS